MKTLKQMLNITTARDRTNGLVCSAIRARRPVEFYYHGGYRTVEPFCLGLVLHGGHHNESLLCYQTGGFAELRHAAGWKLYRASEMEDITVVNAEFIGNRPGYDPDEIPMEQVYCRVIPLRKAAGAPARSIDELIHGTPAAGPVRLTHNDIMELFRWTHPAPIPELETLEEIEALTDVLPENAEPVPLPMIPVLETIDTRPLAVPVAG